MKAWIKTAGANNDPVNYHRWQELIDDFDNAIGFAAGQETEEAVVNLWLEDPRSFMEGLESSPEGENQRSAVRRVKTGGNGLKRYPMTRTASVTGWDQEFSDAKNHANEVLRKLGNIRG